MPGLEQLDGTMPPLDLPYPAYNGNYTSSPMDEYASQPHGIYESYLPTPEDQPSFSAGLTMPPFDWAAIGLDTSGTLGTTYSQPPSYASFDHNLGRPGLTASSSGEPSEVDEIITQSIPSPEVPEVIRYPSTSSEQATFESYQLREPATYIDIPQISTLAGSNSMESFGADNYFQGTTASPAEFEEFRNGTPSDQEAFIRHLTLQDAQKLAHPSVPTEAMGELSIPATRDTVTDPLWAPSFPDDASSFDGVEEPESEWNTNASGWPTGSAVP